MRKPRRGLKSTWQSNPDGKSVSVLAVLAWKAEMFSQPSKEPAAPSVGVNTTNLQQVAICALHRRKRPRILKSTEQLITCWPGTRQFILLVLSMYIAIQLSDFGQQLLLLFFLDICEAL